MEQEFEFIKGYENIYKINRNGDVYSCHYQKNMKCQTHEDGYLYVHIKDVNRKRHKSYVHRLLALQYHPNPDNLAEVDHIDRNKINNNLSNLRWVTKTENRHNRPDYKDHLTIEQLELRKSKKREYKKNWASKNRLEKGIIPRNPKQI